MIKVLFVAAELAPWAKTGGLGDVAAALPMALRRIGIDCRVLVPGYPTVLAATSDAPDVVEVDAWADLPAARIAEGSLGGVSVFVVRCDPLYARAGGPYHDADGREWPDNAHRFALLSRAASLLGGGSDAASWQAQVVHANDWPTGLVPAYMHFADGPAAATLFTVHNIAYQGNFHADLVAEVGLPRSCLDMHGAEFHGQFSFLKAGLYYSDHATTVSPTHAAELQTEALGHGLHGLLRGRRRRLTGILNGIDVEAWNPATDKHLMRRYTSRRLDAKRDNKADLQRALGLLVDPDVPLFGMVGRLVPQKGVDLVLRVLPGLVDLPAQLAVLGTGEAGIEEALKAAAARHPGRIGVSIGFDEGLAHRIEAGADFFLMPSRYEPCGLNQMYSQRYGTPPIVHATGGLGDSVTHCTAETLAAGTATGFQFQPFDAASLLDALRMAARLYEDRRRYRSVQRSGMGRDFGWEAGAKSYAQLYGRLVD